MRGFAGWIVVRTVLIADVMMLATGGVISLIWVSRPAGILAAAGMWLLAGGLLGLLPLTDPYRVQQRRARKASSTLAR